MPCLVVTVLPSTSGSKSRCTPSREMSGPPCSPRLAILSISSRNTMPFCSTLRSARVFKSSSLTSLPASSSVSSLSASFTRRRRRPRRLARGCAARFAAAGRGQHRHHQARHRAHRSRPVHRLWRLSSLEAVGPHSGAAGASPHPRRIECPHGRRLRAHPHRARRLAHRAIRRAARDRGCDAAICRRRHPPPRRDRLVGQRAHREHRGTPPAHGDGASPRDHLVRRRRSFRRDLHHRSHLSRSAARTARAGRGHEPLHPLTHTRQSTAIASTSPRDKHMSTPTPRPTDIRQHRASRELAVAFDDGAHFKLPCEYLRVYSPSAEVRGHGPGQEVLQLGKENVNITAIEPVGHYAVKLYFVDGHNSGIYSWDVLYHFGSRQTELWQVYFDVLSQAGYQRQPRT